MSNSVYRILGKRGRVTIPYEIRLRVGFATDDVLSFTEHDGNTVIVRREKICDHCNGKEPISAQEVTLQDFLDGLSQEEQRAALIHLSVKWAERQAVSSHE